MRRTRWTIGLLWLGLGLAAAPAPGITVEGTLDATRLAQALLPADSGAELRSATLSAHQDPHGKLSSGLFTNPSDTYGLGYGIVLSSGGVNDYGDGPNTSEDLSTNFGVRANTVQAALATQVTGNASFKYYDLTQLEIGFDVLPGASRLDFEVVFATEEWPEYVGSKFIDGFGIFLDGQNVASVGGRPVNVNHPDMAAIPGTELDGALAPGGDPRLRFSIPLVAVAGGDPNAPDHKLSFLVFDTSDAILDATVFISALSVTPVPVPEPATALLLGAGLSALALARPQAAPNGAARREA